ncbi:MAG: glycoside hydrolase family 31 protein [Eubacteriales bacterium]|nr:glycoside hydrolase family 31 protein [Eubacteriales bacterium]
MAIFDISNQQLLRRQGDEQILIQPWGKDGLRVRVTRNANLDTDQDWALLPQPTDAQAEVRRVKTKPSNKKQLASAGNPGEDAPLVEEENAAAITNGRLTAFVDRHGYISFRNQRGEELLREYVRNRSDLSEYSVPLAMKARHLLPHSGTDDYRLIMSFEAYDNEKLYGMGQYQEDRLNLKGAKLELAQRNSQISSPFLVSSRGYGFLWNNPAVGDVTFARNVTRWTARSTRQIDYWICAGDTPAEIEEAYAGVTGTVPMMRDDLMGFWQCKLRYRTQDELLGVVREHKRRGLPLDAIVIDFFHWTMQGDWEFDSIDWPDPEAMVEELNAAGVNLVVSVWPTVDVRSKNFPELAENGYLIRNDRGGLLTSLFMGDVTLWDALNPGARDFIWRICKKNYYDKGIKLFWLDSAEPIYNNQHIDNLHYHMGPALQNSNSYPLYFAKAFYDGLAAEGEQDIMCLIRCGWAGSQRYGALVWSGDIHSSFKSMRQQITAGINAGMAGLPWWTTDIGGFLAGFPAHDDFRELLVRWFAWGCFQPVMRLHGDRLPYKDPEPLYRNGVEQFGTGAENEVWSFGDDNYEILKKYLFLRESLKPYIHDLMKAAHEKGTPVMRPLFYEFPDDPAAWDIDETYMFGPDILVAPVYEAGVATRSVYLPAGETWRESSTGQLHDGGQWVTAHAPLDVIPLFIRRDAVGLPI